MNWTAVEDHQNMMDQLGIKALRPGPSGNESAPNHANYDKSKANPFPDLPDTLTLKNGKKVETAPEWWHQRRPEIVEDFEREVLGRVPNSLPKVTWTITNTTNSKAGVSDDYVHGLKHLPCMRASAANGPPLLARSKTRPMFRFGSSVPT